jgi:hypothetical protein
MQPYGLKHGAHCCEGFCCGGPNDKLRIKRRERQKSKEEINDAKADTVPDDLLRDESSGFGAFRYDQQGAKG